MLIEISCDGPDLPAPTAGLPFANAIQASVAGVDPSDERDWLSKTKEKVIEEHLHRTTFFSL